MGDSSFRRLLLDTVATAIAQPPSASSLVELLRIATPNLIAPTSPSSTSTSTTNGGGYNHSNPREHAEVKVRNASQREKLFRALQLRIHPDKHAGCGDHDRDRATALFQEVTLFYERCVDVMEREDRDGRRRRWSKTSTASSAANNDFDARRRYDEEMGGSSPNNNVSDNKPTQFPQWYPWWYRHHHRQTKRNNNPLGSSTTHSNYERCDDTTQQQQTNQSQYPNRTRTPTRPTNNHPNGRRNSTPSNTNTPTRRQPPSSHLCHAAIATLLFPPFGLFALYHAYQVRKAWNEHRSADARDHSDRAYSFASLGILVFVIWVLWHWLREDGDGGGDWDWDWDWDRMKKNFGWDDGP
mmetsp:Transcript_6515/g.14384  ORF Transcript_6515/g.14384 Transcript_6515/m.14384 type:complete len:354 (+) Transcript_6515:1195-2256(+)